MNTPTDHEQPAFDLAARYQIELQGQVDAEWLQDFDASTEIVKEEPAQSKDVTRLSVHTDQAGLVGLVRQLHGLGLTILKVQLITGKEE